MTKSTIMPWRGSELLATASLAALLGACGSAPKPEVKTAAPTRPKVKTAADYAADAASALEAGNYAAAVKAYDAVLARDAGNGDVLYNRAYALHQLGDLDAAQAAYEETLEADPGSVDAAINLGAILKEKGELGRAIEVTERALEAEPFNGRLLNNLSVLHREKGNYQEAVAAVRKLLMRDKENVDAYKNLSLVYYEQEKYQLSQTILENALKMAKEQGVEDPDIYVNLGMLFLAKDQNGKAMAAFKKAKGLDPDHPVANYNIGALALGHRDYSLAAESYETVSKSWKDNFDVVVGRGYALQGQGKLEEAASTLEKARSILVKMPRERPSEEKEILEQLMVIYQSAEQPQKALSYAEEYMKAEGLSCGPEDYEGFCSRYNGIKLMIEMAEEAAAPAEPEPEAVAKDASESEIFTEGEEPVPGEEGDDASGSAPAEGDAPAGEDGPAENGAPAEESDPAAAQS
jgi:tetratricopeptide (TPR) repeat protein